MSLVQQFTGINAVVFYSNQIFKGDNDDDKSERSARIGTLIFGIVNMGSALSSTIWLKYFGRKTLVVFGQFAMAVSLGLFVLFTLLEQDTLIKVMTMFFTFFFEISIGPILWLYLAEISVEKALSVSVTLNWMVVILITLTTPPLMSWSPHGTFSIFAGCCLTGGLFTMFFMRETKGLTKEECGELYTPKSFQRLAKVSSGNGRKDY